VAWFDKEKKKHASFVYYVISVLAGLFVYMSIGMLGG